MDQSSKTEDSTVQRGSAESASPRTSRRSFLRGAARKAVYMTPIVLTLTASHAEAGSGDYDSTCGDPGSPCAGDGDCCGANTCVALSCT
jgi:hypothetical protein